MVGKVEKEGKITKPRRRKAPIIVKPVIKTYELDVLPVEFRPNICRTCFGTNLNARLAFANYGNDCSMCKRKFRVVKWPNTYKRNTTTQICNSCSEQNNVCRVCGQACLEENSTVPIRVRQETAMLHSKNEDDDEDLRESSPGHRPGPFSYFC
ncbi:hypothetical protein AQUCO_02700168v1 [Aquilegia coerulea]|uniref:STL11/RBM22-like N-terminal domain-containing protein n=1 Tax=Aquilegia coerulea TaxID=218851 RepID=A0A2G5D5I1_AQUCA|nr:hypothetical protein AQUCO_02700168v1 [Aquilegia coerulea]